MSDRLSGIGVFTAAMAVVVLACSGPLRAAPIGHWQFEGTAGDTIGTVPNLLGPGFLDGTGQNGAVYSGSTNGMAVLDPITGSTYANSTSLDAGGSARVRVSDNAALDAPSFTIEAFVLIGADQAGYPRYVAHMASGRGWQVGFDPQEEARARFDTAALGNQTVGSGSNQALGVGNWHHTAVTFDAATKLIAHYTDYTKVATRTLTGTASDATAVAANLMFGDSALPAGTLVDEVRYSNSVLSTSGFLRPVGEGFWRFEGTPGATIGTTVNTASPGHLDGVGGGGAVYSSDVPYGYTTDPTTGKIYVNETSLDMSSGNVTVPFDPDLNDPQFTIEAFVKIQDQAGYPNFIDRLNGGVGWQVDVNPNEYARARFDTVIDDNQTVGSTSAQSLADGDWHHVAVTFDGALMQIYVDYDNLATRTLNGDPADITEVTWDLIFGNNSWSAGGNIDEIRYSGAVLTPDQFLLAAVPEPSTFALAGLGLLGLALIGRRRRR